MKVTIGHIKDHSTLILVTVISAIIVSFFGAVIGWTFTEVRNFPKDYIQKEAIVSYVTKESCNKDFNSMKEKFEISEINLDKRIDRLEDRMDNRFDKLEDIIISKKNLEDR